jgi:hypothetical protein
MGSNEAWHDEISPQTEHELNEQLDETALFSRSKLSNLANPEYTNSGYRFLLYLTSY